MPDHDEFCPVDHLLEARDTCLWCTLLDKARADERRQVILDGEAGIIYHDLEAEWRADERERIAEHLEYEAGEYNGDPRFQAVTNAYLDAARIARSGWE